MHWFWVDDRFTASPYVAKFLQAKATICGGVEASAVVAVATDYREDPAEAESTLRKFLARLAPLKPILRQAGKREAARGNGGAPAHAANYGQVR